MTAVRASMSVPLSDPRPLYGGIQGDILAQKSPGRKVKPPGGAGGAGRLALSAPLVIK